VCQNTTNGKSVQVRISHTLRKKRAKDPLRFGWFDAAAAALFVDVKDESLASAAFLGLDICIGINI